MITVEFISLVKAFLIDLDWTIIFSATLALPIFYHLLTRPQTHYPPGPKGWPIIGNLLQLSSTNHLEELASKWAGKFGDVLYIRVLNRDMIILNSLDAARDLLDRRSSTYSDRPHFVLMSDMMGLGDETAFLRYGPRFRKHRRFIQQSFNQNAVTVFQPLQERGAVVLLDNLVRTPQLFAKHFKMFAAATLFPITYGHPVTSADDEFMKFAEEVSTLTVRAGIPATTPVDFFPALRHIPSWAPFSGFKRKALEARVAVKKMMDIPFETVKKEMLLGQAQPCFISTLLKEYCDPEKPLFDSENEVDIKAAAATLYGAGEDTTVAFMETFVLAMVRNPEVLRKAQAETDKVVGTERLPNLSDRGSLQYLECILKEVLRWNTPVPLGLPHRVIEDDLYLGYYIPKGATILANIYKILNDCDRPSEFIPERYFDTIDLPNPLNVVFGFGRRICPGRYFAETSIWYMMANMIATLDIERTSEDMEKNIFPELQVIPGFVRHPKPFSCILRPRSKMTATLIHDAQTYSDF